MKEGRNTCLIRGTIYSSVPLAAEILHEHATARPHEEPEADVGVPGVALSCDILEVDYKTRVRILISTR